MPKTGLAIDISLSAGHPELVDSIQGAARIHITWPGIDPDRPKSSLLTITFYDAASNVVKVCGGAKRKINVRVPRPLTYAIDSQELCAADIGYIIDEIKRIVSPTLVAAEGDPSSARSSSSQFAASSSSSSASVSGSVCEVAAVSVEIQSASSVDMQSLVPPPGKQKQCSSCAVEIQQRLPHGSCPGSDTCVPCFVVVVDAACSRFNTSTPLTLTCSLCMAVLEPSYVHAFLATSLTQDAIKASLR